jgi:hypothetical protein
MDLSPLPQLQVSKDQALSFFLGLLLQHLAELDYSIFSASRPKEIW